MSIDKFRDYLSKTQSIEINLKGQEVLVGLSFDETLWYFDYCRTTPASRDLDYGVDQRKYLKLHDRHQRVRRKVQESEARMK